MILVNSLRGKVVVTTDYRHFKLFALTDRRRQRLP